MQSQSFNAKKHSSFDLELADANKVLYDLAHQNDVTVCRYFIWTGSVKQCIPKLFVRRHMYTVDAVHSARIVVHTPTTAVWCARCMLMCILSLREKLFKNYSSRSTKSLQKYLMVSVSLALNELGSGTCTFIIDSLDICPYKVTCSQ